MSLTVAIIVGALVLIDVLLLSMIIKLNSRKLDTPTNDDGYNIDIRHLYNRAIKTDRKAYLNEININGLPDVKAARAEKKMKEAQEIIDSIGDK